MRKDTETAAAEALHEKGQELFNRLLLGEDVHAEVELWQKRVERMASPLCRFIGNVYYAYYIAREKIKFIVLRILRSSRRQGNHKLS